MEEPWQWSLVAHSNQFQVFFSLFFFYYLLFFFFCCFRFHFLHICLPFFFSVPFGARYHLSFHFLLVTRWFTMCTIPNSNNKYVYMWRLLALPRVSHCHQYTCALEKQECTEMWETRHGNFIEILMTDMNWRKKQSTFRLFRPMGVIMWNTICFFFYGYLVCVLLAHMKYEFTRTIRDSLLTRNLYGQSVCQWQ